MIVIVFYKIKIPYDLRSFNVTQHGFYSSSLGFIFSIKEATQLLVCVIGFKGFDHNSSLTKIHIIPDSCFFAL